MNLSKEVALLVSKEIRLEIRSKYNLASLLLYSFATVFVSYLSFKKIIVPATWNALFWIIVLFSAINATTKSFSQENRGRYLYYYSVHSANAFLLAKIIYNSFLLVLLSAVTFLFYGLFIHSLVQDYAVYLVVLFIGSITIATVLTMMAAIASKTANNIAMMAILSIPMLIPVITLIIKISKNAVDGLERSLNYPYLAILVLLNVLILMLSIILFPYLWRE